MVGADVLGRPPRPRRDNSGARRTHLPMRDLFARLTAEGKDMRPLPWRNTQTTCHGVSDNVRPFLGIMGLIPYTCIKEPALKTKVPRLRQKRLEVANRFGQPTHAREWMGSTIPNNARLFRSFVGYIHQHVEMIGHDQAERHEPLARHMVMPYGLQDHRRIFHKIRHAARPGTDRHEEERPRRAIGRVMIEAFTNRQVVHVFQCSTNEIPAQCPPSPSQRRDDAGGRYNRAGRRGRRPLPTPHIRGARRVTRMVGPYMVGPHAW